MAQSTQSYVPGVCNINPKEIASRRMAGHFGVGLFVIILAALIVFSLPFYLRIALFVPAFIAAIGYLQARNKFCVGYAAAGQHNAEEGSTKANSISDKDSLSKDKQKARSMNVQALAIALAVTFVTFLIPA